MKRNNRIKPFAAGLIFLCAAVSAGAGPMDLEAVVDAGVNRLIVNLSLINFPEDQILSALSRGYRSEISFTVKVYRQDRGMSSLFGGSMVTERGEVFTAGWDQFEQIYYILDGGGKKRTFVDEAGFFDSLEHLRDFSIPLNSSDSEGLYANIIVKIIPVKLSPPLTIINLLRTGNMMEISVSNVAVPSEGLVGS